MKETIEHEELQLDEYAAYLNNLAEQEQNVVFLNSSAKHASMVMARIFKHSDKEVLIMAGDLNGAVSHDQEYITELMDFLFRGGELKILISKYDKDNPPAIFKYIKLLPTSQVEVKKTDIRFVIPPSNEEVHFTIGSKKADISKARMFRLEHNINKYLANGNFNDPDLASILYEQFYSAYNSPKSTNVILN